MNELYLALAMNVAVGVCLLLQQKNHIKQQDTTNAEHREALANLMKGAQDRLVVEAASNREIQNRSIDALTKFSEDSSAHTQATVAQTNQMAQLTLAVTRCAGANGG